MKNFLSHLLDEGKIKANDLLPSLVKKIETNESMALTVYKENLLPEDKQLEILLFQINHRCDYPTACHELGVWTEALSRQIFEKQSQKYTSIYDILVTNECISFEDLSTEIDNYISLIKSKPTPEYPSVKDHTDVMPSMQSAKAETQDLADEKQTKDDDKGHDFIFAEISQPIIESFRDVCAPEDMKEELYSAIDNLIANPNDESLRENVLLDLKQFNDAAKFSQLELADILTQKMCDTLEHNKASLTPQTLDKLQKGIDLFWMIFDDLIVNRSEKEFYSNRKKQFNDTIANLG